MNPILEECLYEQQYKRYSQLSDATRLFASRHCGNTIIRNGIFGIIENYARRMEFRLELLRYPFHDDELWAMTFVKQGIVFVCINTDLALCKQFYAAAHELYHIYCYVEEMDDSYIRGGSLLSSQIADTAGATQEDLEANAFAGLLLMPSQMLYEQMELYGIERGHIDVDSMLTLADIFAMPYKSVVLRLYETQCINRQQADAFLSAPSDRVKRRILLTGKARSWLQDGKGTEQFGHLLTMAAYCEEHDCLTDSRRKEDQAYIQHLQQKYAMG